MKLSIVLPVYNTPEKYLNRCLNSIRYQDESDFEVIIVDDGSGDTTARLLDEYVLKDARFKVFHKRNEGVSKARNYGIERAAGEFISFIDADDYVDSSMVSYAFKIQEQYDADMVMWQYDQVVNGKSKAAFYQGNGVDVFDDTNKEILTELVLNEEAYYGKYYWNILICTWGKMYRTEAVKKVRFPENIIINEDGLYIFQAIQECHRFVITDKILYHYVQWEGSAGHAMHTEIGKNWIRNRQEYMRLMKAGNYSQKVYHAYDINVMAAVRFMLFHVWANPENRGEFNRSDFSRFMNQREIHQSIKKLKTGDLKKTNTKICLVLLKLRMYHFLKILTSIRVNYLRRRDDFV